MTPIPYLTFKGNCAEALAHYREVFDSPPPDIMTLADAPEDVRERMPESSPQAIMHAALKIGDGWIYASDDIMGGSPKMAGCAIMTSLPDPTRARAVFDALVHEGTITMDFQPTFWSSGFGTLTDRWGVHWMISTDEPED